MPGPNFVLDKGYSLAAARSGNTDAYPAIYNVVKIYSTGVAGQTPMIQTSTSSGEKVLGVVQEDTPGPTDSRSGGKDYALLGRIVNVRILGITRVIATGVIAVGTRVKSNGDGTVVAVAATTANQECVGIALGASAATGDQIDLLLTPGMQTHDV